MKNYKAMFVIFNNVSDMIFRAFAKKHDLQFDYWVGVDEDRAGVASFNEQYFFNMCDIKEDLQNRYPKGDILEWQDYCVELRMKNDLESPINLRNFVKHRKQLLGEESEN